MCTAKSSRPSWPDRAATAGLAVLAALLVCLGLRAEPTTSAATKPHWAFQPVANPPPPTVHNAAWIRSSLDAFILARIEAAGLQPLPEADRRTLVRRVAFDLTGLPPTPAEVDAFLNDSAPDAYARMGDRYLDSPRYGEHWGRHWLDVVRYADTAGETADYPVPSAWRYRNYVIDAFNADKPYDRFLQEQIAGDILARDAPREQRAEMVTATGYLASSRRFGFDSENYHNLTIQDTIDNLGQGILGLSLGCARCHDHKYDPVSTADYYGLYGIFDSSRYPFPGSEQKSKSRTLVPLDDTDNPMSDWGEVNRRIEELTRTLQRNQQSTPPAVLRSLTDIDGDFEIQAPAAGGSNGVLVPPWIYEGLIAVTREAQSPFQNLHPTGNVGVAPPGGTNAYFFGQALYPRRTHTAGGRLFLNFDFRIAASDGEATGVHRLWLGTRVFPEGPATNAATHSPALEVLISGKTVALRSDTGTGIELARIKAGRWYNLRLTLDLSARSVSGELADNETGTALGSHPFLGNWRGAIDFLGLRSDFATGPNTPRIDVDNFATREVPIPAPSAQIGSTDGTSGASLPKLQARLSELAGLDGDFELQTDAKPPAKPWGPGPNSPVMINAQAQSSFTNLYPPGTLGVRLPPGGAYNGFGQTLSNAWKAPQTTTLYVAFDFRIDPASDNGSGSWRYYLGHGPGSSAAIELFMTRDEFFARSGDDRPVITKLSPGWHQVQFTLNFKDRNYSGWIANASERHEFRGTVASGWDGTIDYTFIDSFGHRGGSRPSLDADNFAIRTTPLPTPDAPKPAFASLAMDRRAEAIGLRKRTAELQTQIDSARRELEHLLADDSLNLAYAMSEGTPRNSRIQLRGEQDRLGPEVPRGFIKVLGGRPLPASTAGSGRVELAHWVTDRANPLTARVFVNRVWHYHFGNGLVRTPNDFGIRGEAPTHPDLLDHLASRFMASGWSVKAMHRWILNSSTYRQQSASPTADPDNRLFARASRRRLEAESVRDSILYVSGGLDPTPGRSHPFPAPTGWGFSQHAPFSAAYDHDKRSVYLMTQRIKRHPFLALFDGADPNASTPKRSISTVPTQALYFMNDPFVHQKSLLLGRRLQADASNDGDRVTMAYSLTLGRAPTSDERTKAESFLDAYRAELAANGNPEVPATALAALARSLFASNEFMHVD